LNLRYRQYSKIIAYADELVNLVKESNHVEVENYVNIETQKVTKWASIKKMGFKDKKSKVMIITKKRPNNRRDKNLPRPKKRTTGIHNKLLWHYHRQTIKLQ